MTPVTSAQHERICGDGVANGPLVNQMSAGLNASTQKRVWSAAYQYPCSFRLLKQEFCVRHLNG